jgi:hypothetical protein
MIGSLVAAASSITFRRLAPMAHDCRAFSQAELRALIASGKIRDANTLAAFARLVAMGFC